MDVIQYKKDENNTKVYLNQKHVGTICMVMGFCYYPKGDITGGDIFKTEKECRESLEDD